MFIGRYRVCGLLGRGGMGAVYKVLQPVTGRMAALKLLRPSDVLEELVGTEELARRFYEEARIMGQLEHPHVAAVLDADHDARNRPFFLMEYYCLNLGMLIGESYRVEAPTRRLPLDRAVRYARQTLEALRRMHYAGIVHRDVKPYNIMITADDDVKLIDFGLSRLRGETGHGTAGRLHKGVKVGSPYYAPPEQENDPESADARADIYPVGVMLYRMLTGVLPTGEEVMAEGGIPPASQFSDDLDAEWDVFFERAMAPDPGARFACAAAMLDRLNVLERRWRARVTNTCTLAGASPLRRQCPPVHTDVRTVPLKAGTREARGVFGLDDLWRPLCPAGETFEDQGDMTVLDSATDLMWQQSGSDYPLTWDEAAEYVHSLNAMRFAGYGDWRLPTVAELVTQLAEPPMLGDYCVPPVFDIRCDVLWSADTKSHVAAWFVSASMGFVGWQDFTCRFSVRAVRTHSGE